MVLEEFFKENQDLKVECVDATPEIQKVCSEKNKHIKADLVKSAYIHILQTMTNANMMRKFQAQRCKKNAMFKSMMNDLHRVETILFFVAASWTADLKLHLESKQIIFCNG